MTDKKIKVLHSIYCLGRGGLETWLMNLVRQKSPELQFDFAVNGMWGGYEEEAQDYGCQFHCQEPPTRLKRRLQILGLAPRSRFLETVLAANDYDVFHIHGEEFMGDSVKVAAKARVPVRVVHCHGTALARGRKSMEMTIRSMRFKTIDRERILKYATDIVACSSDAGRFLMGSLWATDLRCRPLYCGVPLEQFGNSLQIWTRKGFRAAHGIPEDGIVIGHAGSMGPSPVKNHGFIIEIFHELAKRDRRYYLYLAGDGPLRPAIEQDVQRRGLDDRVIMPGLCSDVPSLMIHGFDAHLLPSLHEGLPIVGLEAVAAGLYTVCSDTITKDFTDYFSSRVATAALDATPSYWADRAEQSIHRRIPAEEGIALVENSPFSIKSSLREVIRLYRNRLNNKSTSEMQG